MIIILTDINVIIIMYRQIISDYLLGLLLSLRIDIFINSVYNNVKLQNVIVKIIKHNILLHFLPYLLFFFVNIICDISLMTIFNIVIYPLNMFSVFIHILHYRDLINIASTYSPKSSLNKTTMDRVSLTITMSIYQFAIFLTTTIINYVLERHFYIFALIINLVILLIYHSFYCYNNLWQYKNIPMDLRIDMHEKLWPYYIGFGTIGTILYLYCAHPIVLGIYNLYMAVVISMPFFVKPRYPKKDILYPSINLSIFSYITGYLFFVFKKILQLN